MLAQFIKEIRERLDVEHRFAVHEDETVISGPKGPEETDRSPGRMEEHLGLFVLRWEPHAATAAVQVEKNSVQEPEVRVRVVHNPHGLS